MASIGTEQNGRRRILFTSSDGKRKTLRLGKCSQRDAQAVKMRVELILISQLLRNPPDAETWQWLASLDDVMYARLAAVGLCNSRESLRLGAWIDRYLGERTDLKLNTVRNNRAARIHLVNFFGEDRDMRTITRDEASAWEAKMRADGLARATVRLYVGNTRTLFEKAKKRELIHKNPFDHLASGTTASANLRYVTPEEAAKVIDALGGDRRSQLVFALARYAGLRVPSETKPLTWKDVDWDKRQIHVRSPKTEHHAGKESRVVPVMPELYALLEEAYHAAPEGSTLILEHRSNEYTRQKVFAGIDKAGIERWEDIFRVLRSSCEKQWAMSFPQFAVSKWMGHGIAVSGKHYANFVPDELFARAARNPALAASESGSQEQPAATVGTENGDRNAPARTANFDPSNRRNGDSPGKSADFERRGAKSGARGLSDLSRITRAGKLARKMHREYPCLRSSFRKIAKLAKAGAAP